MTDWSIFESLVRAIGRSLTWDGEIMVRLRASYLRELHEEMKRRDPRRRVLPGIRELLADLDSRSDVHLGLQTGNLEQGAREKLEPFAIHRFFPGGGFGSDDPDRRRVVRIAREQICRIRRIDVPPERVGVVGDTVHDVEAALANGFRAIAVATGWSSMEELERARPHALVSDLADRRRALDALGL
jgi:phosphoglycolate phosphatase-like HAD superfamily hydrolase